MSQALRASFVFGILVTSLVAQAQEPRRFAVLVGVEAYDHGKLDPLVYAEDDARELADLLGKVNYQVSLLCDSAGKKSADQAPTKKNIDAALAKVLDQVKRTDTVVVALMGHGLFFGGGNDSYFCPQDARPIEDRKDTLVSLNGLYKQLDDSGAGIKVLLVDACRNDPDPGRGRGIDADTAPRPPRGVAVLFSCSSGERAFEHDSLKHGVFTHFVLEGLKGAARDTDGDVSFQALAGYVTKHTARAVPKLIDGRQQSPNLKADLSGVPPVLLNAADLALLTKTSGGKPGEIPAVIPPVEPEKPAAERKAGDEIKNDLGMKLVWIPPGRFMMGSTTQETGRKTDEQQHWATLSRGFYLGAYEVTQAEYRTVMGINPSWFASTGGGRQMVQGLDSSRSPAEQVSWEDAMEFCRRLAKRENKPYRLPTEAEWEYACRAGSTSPFNVGATLDLKQGNFLANGNLRRTTSVGRFPANAWGLFDMHGNVSEWCLDSYDPGFYRNAPPKDPRNQAGGTLRVGRGGSWNCPSANCRSALRYGGDPTGRWNSLGLRVALDVEDK